MNSNVTELMSFPDLPISSSENWVNLVQTATDAGGLPLPDTPISNPSLQPLGGQQQWPICDMKQ